VWAYTYQIVPPQPKRRLGTIRALLDREHTVARQDARTWASRLVLERWATRILIVSDSADQARAVDRALAGEVRRLQATFTLTEPVEISADTAGGTPTQS
jgi:PleD family two-component response regulator